MLAEIKNFLTKYERVLIPVALFLGIIPDILFFAFVSFDITIITLALHLFFAGLSIAIINLYEDSWVRGKFFAFIRSMAPLVLHFTFGALFSAFVLFYSFSGSIFASWPFILVLAFLVIANEMFRKYNTRPDIHLSVFFFALFSYFNLAIPYLIRSVGPVVFILTGILSLLIVGLFIWMLYAYLPRIRRVIRILVGSIAALFIAMNVFYFTNVIPPIPLSVRDIGIYYNVQRVGDEYRVLSREVGWLESWSKFSIAGEKFPIFGIREAYVFSAIFAPPGMNLEIVHEWQLRGPDGKWITRSKTAFPITGGRSEGFRGYSRAQIEFGHWRVNVKTARGQIINRYRFNAVQTDFPPTYTLEIR